MFKRSRNKGGRKRKVDQNSYHAVTLTSVVSKLCGKFSLLKSPDFRKKMLISVWHQFYFKNALIMQKKKKKKEKKKKYKWNSKLYVRFFLC